MTNRNENPYQSPTGESDERKPNKRSWGQKSVSGVVFGIVFFASFLLALLGYSPSDLFSGTWLRKLDLEETLGDTGLLLALTACLFLSVAAWMLGWGSKK